jgi:ribosomal protein L3 glutamine methyltransferase
MSETNELYTIRDFVRWAVSNFNANGLFFGHGTESAWDEAIALILHTLHLPYSIDPTVLDGRLTLDERKQIETLVKRRIKERIPLAYLTHEAWFAGLPFYVDERVLIPRSSFAELIENQFEPWVKSDEVEFILDLCTGSGCIAISTALAFPDAIIDACDISSDALDVAKINVSRHKVDDQVNLIQSDVFDALDNKQYDLILSNPPYVDAMDMAELPDEYKHEPALGLAAGDDGLEIVMRILREAPNYLTPNGVLMVEVGNSEYALSEKYPDVPFTWLDFKRSEGGVFLLTRDQLVEYQADFK